MITTNSTLGIKHWVLSSGKPQQHTTALVSILGLMFFLTVFLIAMPYFTFRKEPQR